MTARIEQVQAVIDRLKSKYSGISGISKLISVALNEKQVLERSGPKQSIQSLCSNLPHVISITNSLTTESDILSVYESKRFECSDGSAKNVRIDIVAENGLKWIKVKSNLHTLNADISSLIAENEIEDDSDDEEDEMDIMALLEEKLPLARQLKDMYIASLQSKCHYKIPGEFSPSSILAERCLAIFVRIELDAKTEPKLESINCHILQFIQSLPANLELQTPDGRIYAFPFSQPIQSRDALRIINVDVTTLIALSSDMIFPGATIPEAVRSVPALNVQVIEEAKNPFSEFIKLYLSHCEELICSRAVLQKFAKIVALVAGPDEKMRGRHLFDEALLREHAIFDSFEVGLDERRTIENLAEISLPCKIKVIESGAQSSDNDQELLDSVKIVADRFQALTLTANKKLASSLNSVVYHKPRSFIGRRK